MTTARSAAALALPVLALLATAGPAPAQSTSAPTLPKVLLDTAGPIPNDPKVPARVRVVDARGRTVEDGAAGVERRGQSSQVLPRKSYDVELRDAAGKGRDVALLGLPADDDWALQAAAADPTLVRNAVAYATVRWMGRWAARTRFVEVVLNGASLGTYVLSETPELGRDRVRVPARRGAEAFLLETTFVRQAERKGDFWRTPITRRAHLFDDPDEGDLSKREERAIRAQVHAAERALHRGPRGAWRRHLDPGAATDYVLAQELFRNLDAFHASTYLAGAAGTRLRFGPVWDFDQGMGNATASGRRPVTGLVSRTRTWADRLWRDPAFRRGLARRWRELRGRGLRAHVLRTVDRSAAQARGSDPREVARLRTWLGHRIGWLDGRLR